MTIQDIWFIGDNFLRENFEAFKNLQKKAYLNRTNPPYLYGFFNVFAYFQSKNSSVKGLACIFNTFLEGLNGRKSFRPPCFLIFVMDKDFIVNMNFFGYGALKVMSMGLQWLIRQVNICLKQRKTELFDKKPGAIALESMKIIWVKMIKHPYGCLQEFNKIFALRNRFNNILDEVLCNTNPQHHVLSIRVEENDFHLNGELNEQGEITFWKEVDQCMKKFDRGEINLKPKGSKDFGSK